MSRHPQIVRLVLILCALFSLSACLGESKEKAEENVVENESTASLWDSMKWDQNNWQ